MQIADFGSALYTDRVNIQQISTKYKRFSIVEPDNIAFFTQATGIPIDTQSLPYSQLIQVAVEELSESVTGMSLSPEYGLEFITDKTEKAGLVLRLNTQEEKPNYEALPTLIPQWGVEAVANNYAVAQLVIWYNPYENLANQKKKFIAEIFDYCNQLDIHLLLTIRIFLIEGQTLSFADTQLQTVKELQQTAHLLALEYPESALSAATLTAESDIPWMLLSDPKDTYAEYKDKLRICLESGASGSYIDRLVWAGFELDQEVDAKEEKLLNGQLDNLKNFIRTTARDRVIELARICAEYSLTNTL